MFTLHPENELFTLYKLFDSLFFISEDNEDLFLDSSEISVSFLTLFVLTATPHVLFCKENTSSYKTEIMFGEQILLVVKMTLIIVSFSF